MKKIILTAGIWIGLVTYVKGQHIGLRSRTNAPSFDVKKDKSKDHSTRKLHLDEINILSSYYTQEGDNSAVTGGAGTEELDDVSSGIELIFKHLDKNKRENTWSFDTYLDFYSSASSDRIDSRSVSSASMTDIHFYPSFGWSRKDEQKHNSLGASLSFSTEYDYKSVGGHLAYSKFLNEDNTELSFRLSTFFDKMDLILPHDLRPEGYPSGAEGDRVGLLKRNRNTYDLNIGLYQVINERSQILFSFDPSIQTGFLSTSFHRVYFSDQSRLVERLPTTRYKFPASVRYNYFLGDQFIIKSFYRFYADNWSLIAHTFSLEIPVKITPFFSISPFYRYHHQNKVKYFRSYGKHSPSEEFYTSDYDLSTFDASFFGTGIRIAPPGGVFGLKKWNVVELRYGIYKRSDNLYASILTFTTKIE